MDLNQLTQDMAARAEAILSLAQGVPEEEARWKPAPDSWSILEVINHLYDEERLDFRAHLDLILHHPDQPWTSIDPQGWVTERRYNERDLQESLQNFLDERETSLAWLRGLAESDWQAPYTTPFRTMTAGDMLASWVAHDLLHLRQLVELHWACNLRAVHPYEVAYAGEW